jgi:hypothetical protein
MKDNPDKPPALAKGRGPGAANPAVVAAKRLAPGLIAHLLKSPGADPVPGIVTPEMISLCHAEFIEFCEDAGDKFTDWRKAWNAYRFQPTVGEAVERSESSVASAKEDPPAVAAPKKSRRRKSAAGAGPTPVVFDPFAAAPPPNLAQPEPKARRAVASAKAGFVYVPPQSPLRVVRVVTPGADGSNIVSVSFAPEPERSEPVADPEPSVSEETAARWLQRFEQRRLAALTQE